MDLTALIIKMVIFFFLMLIGFFLTRKDIVTSHFVKDTSTILLNVFLVASILNSVLGERPELSRKEFITAFCLVSLTIIICYVTAFLFSRPFRKENNAAQTETSLAITNALFIGLPVLSSTFGSEAVFFTGISCITYNITLYSYGVFVLKKGTGTFKISDMLSIPLIAAILSLVIFALNPPIPSLVSQFVSTVAGGTVPLSMIVIGASLGKINPLEAFKEKRFYYLSLIRLIVCPLIVYFIVRIFTDYKALIATCIVLGGCPTGMIETPLSVKYGYDPVYSSKMIMVSTILCMFTIPLLLKVLI